MADIDDCISSTTSGMWSKKVSKLLPYPGIRSSQFYRFEGEVIKFRSLNWHETELAGLCWFDNLAETGMVLLSSEAEDLKAAVRSIVEDSTWMDWWTFIAKSTALQSSQEVLLLKRPFVTGSRCYLLLAKTASTVWANLVLKSWDTVLAVLRSRIRYHWSPSWTYITPLCRGPQSFSRERP